MKATRLVLGLTLMLSLATFSSAQEQKDSRPKDRVTEEKLPEQQGVFKLEFVVSEFDATKKLNERRYMIMALDGTTEEVRTGNRVPIVTGGNPKDPNSGAAQYQYIDMGLNLDVRAKEQGGMLLIYLGSDLSGLAPADPAISTNPMTPTVRQLRQRSTALVPFGRATTVAALDDVNSNRRFEVQVTATRVR